MQYQAILEPVLFTLTPVQLIFNMLIKNKTKDPI